MASAQQRIQRQIHPSRYGASLTRGTTAPRLPKYTTYKAVGAGGRRKKREEKAALAQPALDKGKAPMLTGAAENVLDPIVEIIDLVKDHAAAKGITDVDDLVESIIQANEVSRPVDTNAYGYDGDSPQEKWATACKNASEHIVSSRGGYCNVVFGAAGVCAVGYAQAYLYVKKLGLASQMLNFAGCSSGAIVATMLALRLTPERICELAIEKNFSELARIGTRSIMRFGRKAGIDNGNKLGGWFRQLLNEACGNQNITFGSIHEKFGGRLVIVAVRMRDSRVVYLDHNNAADMPVWKALRITCSTPFIYTPVEHNGEFYTDGSLLDPLPMKAFHYETDGADIINPRTIAFLAINEGISAFRRKPGSAVGNIAAYADCILSRSHNMLMDEQDWARTIVINCGKMSSLDFSINPDMKKELMEKARSAVIDHFAKTKIPVQGDYYGAESNGFTAAEEPEPKDGLAVKTVRRHRVSVETPPAAAAAAVAAADDDSATE